jgi:NAD(P)-dependent dehydrogenase (short-subunit alcohol dehydrogenase family)
MDLELANARVLVTNASEGFEALTARQFSLEGALVVISGDSLPDLQEIASSIVDETTNPVFTLAANVSDKSGAERVVRNAAEMLNGLDVLIASTAAVDLIRAALPYLRQSRRAAVFAVVSDAIEQSLALELEAANVRINSAPPTEAFATIHAAKTAVFLCSPAAQLINGMTFSVDGSIATVQEM